MNIVLVNIAHPAIGSRVPREHLPPLGLLMVGGALLDAGHDVALIDAELKPLDVAEIVARVAASNPNCIMFGHSGSTSGHPAIAAASKACHDALPHAAIVYGGVYPSYHWREILAGEPHVAAIVRGEGESTAVALAACLETGGDLRQVRGIAACAGVPFATPAAEMAENFEHFRIGWELIDFADYSYWGGKRAVVLQFSRGCPHPCTYCGQTGFWTKWRRRDPVAFAKEIAWLHRVHGVELVNLADENPTSSRRAWRAFLEAMIAENVPVLIVGSTRADDIVRDADILHLYKEAGVIRWLMGMENTDAATLALVKKGGSVAKDREAIRLLRGHGIVSMATWVAGFEDETLARLWSTFRQLRAYDPDQIQALYATPHRWTQFFREAAGRRVIQTDKSRWDYKHQVLATRLHPFVLFAAVKLIEALMQSRPKALWRVLAHPDLDVRHAMRWYTRMGRRVWLFEWRHFLWLDRRTSQGPELTEFWGAPQEREAATMVRAEPVIGLRQEGPAFAAPLSAPASFPQPRTIPDRDEHRRSRGSAGSAVQ